MKFPLCLGALIVGQLAVSAAENTETAYTALRVIGRQNGADSLNRVVEVRGRSGTPAPASWKIVLSDPSARGGLREYEVHAGKVTAERTPTARTVPQPINFNQLNLDSEGAYTVANQEAQKAQLPFDRIDYVLESGNGGPLWHVELYSTGEKIGYLDISADTGALVHRNLTKRAGGPPVAQQDREFLRNNPEPPPRVVPPPPPDRRIVREDEYYDRDRDLYREDDDDFRRDRERDHRSLKDKIQNHFERRGMQIKRFFLGD